MPLAAHMFCSADIMPQRTVLAAQRGSIPGKAGVCPGVPESAAGAVCLWPTPAGGFVQRAQIRAACAENGMGHCQPLLFLFGNADQSIKPFLQLFHIKFPCVSM